MQKREETGIYWRKNLLWIHYPGPHDTVREPVHSTSLAKARKLRAKRLEQHRRGEPGRAAELVRVNDLLDAYLTNRTVKGKDVSTAQVHMKALRPAFGHLKFVDCTMDVIEMVQLDWQQKGTSNANINRRLNTLRAAFNRALEAKTIHVVPKVPHLDEPDRRGRHLSATDATALDEQLPPYVQSVFMFAYENGTRKGQLTRTLRRFVDLDRGLISWPKDQCKAKEPHTLVLEGTSLALVASLMKKPPLHCPYLFHGPRCAPGHQPSKHYGCVGDFKRAWRSALKAAGLPVGRKHDGYVFHHTRNTAVTNLRASGLEEADCMAVTGHQTARVFRHYDLGNVDALRQRIAAARTKAATLTPLHSASR